MNSRVMRSACSFAAKPQRAMRRDRAYLPFPSINADLNLQNVTLFNHLEDVTKGSFGKCDIHFGKVQLVTLGTDSEKGNRARMFQRMVSTCGAANYCMFAFQAQTAWDIVHVSDCVSVSPFTSRNWIELVARVTHERCTGNDSARRYHCTRLSYRAQMHVGTLVH